MSDQQTTQPPMPELSEQQIDRMYRQITSRIDHDESARRGRRRKALTAAAAVVVVLGLGGAVVAGLAPSTTSSDTSSDPTYSVPEAAPEARDGAADGTGAAGAPDQPADGGGADGGVAADAAAREVVTTASAHLTVGDARDAADALDAWVRRERGLVQQREESTSDGRTSVSLVLRVPADATGDTTQRLRDLGAVSGLRIEREDVTAQGRDLDARIRALQVSVTRLEELMSRASSTSDLLAAETTLSERQSTLEALQAERRGLSDQVALATYEVFIATKAPADAQVDGGGFLGGLRSGWDGLVAVLGGAVVAVGFVLPWAALLALVGALYLGVRRVVRR